MVRRLAAAAAAGLIGGSLMLAGPAHATGGAEFPSTNEKNANEQVPGREGQSAPHFRVLHTDECGEARVKFVNDTNSLAVFEIRVDGHTPEGLPEHPAKGARDWSPEKLYPDRVSLDGRDAPKVTETKTFKAEQFIEIRLALGGERDWDFDWTKVTVEPCEEEAPFVRITYMCQADGDGITRAFAGGDEHVDVEVNDGDHIWRIRHESGPAASWETNFLGMSGDIDVGEVQFVTTSEGANGVNVSTDPGPNAYGGTASVSGATCEKSIPIPSDDPTDDSDETEEKEKTAPVADEKLPVTGAALPLLIGAGLVLLVGGAAALLLGRRRGLI